jgi:hypothetical protein
VGVVSPDDPRHGQRRGYYAHRRDGEEACVACKRAAAAAEQRYELARMYGKPGRVLALGTKRRLRALQAIGWTLTAIADELGTKRSRVEKWCSEDRTYVYTTTAARVAEVYERLCMTRPTGRWATRTRNLAASKGYAPPLAWLDIDDPSERPAVRPAALEPVRERTYDSPDHRACARCGLVREVNRGRGDLCHDCRIVTREAGAA